jgi:hypothetical protein
VRLQRPLEIARVVAHAELPPNQRRDALQGPALGTEARCRRTLGQQPAEPGPGTIVKLRRPPGPWSGAQPAPALLLQNGNPAADTGAADTEMPGDGRLGHLPLPQQRCRCQAALLQLLRRQARRPPLAAVHRRHPQQCWTARCYQPVEKVAAQLERSGSMLRATAAVWSPATTIRMRSKPPAGVATAAREAETLARNPRGVPAPVSSRIIQPRL